MDCIDARENIYMVRFQTREREKEKSSHVFHMKMFTGAFSVGQFLEHYLYIIFY